MIDVLLISLPKLGKVFVFAYYDSLDSIVSEECYSQFSASWSRLCLPVCSERL